MELTQHPLSAAFPAMSAEDFQALKDDIDNIGQRDPVMLFEGMVLDGWHRFRACLELGIAPAQVTLSPDVDAVKFVLSRNLLRRHLTASQRAAAVVSCSEWQPSSVKKDMVETVSTQAKTIADMAKVAHVTTRTITDAKAAHKAGLGDAVKTGELTVNEAANIARGKPAKKPKPTVTKRAPWVTTDAKDSGPDAAELVAAERAVVEELETLRKIVAADDKLGAAVAEVKKLLKENQVLKATNDALMTKNSELVKCIKRLDRKANVEQPA
jgi:hypothetical protein